jgi:hypothetical protein
MARGLARAPDHLAGTRGDDEGMRVAPRPRVAPLRFAVLAALAVLAGVGCDEPDGSSGPAGSSGGGTSGGAAGDGGRGATGDGGGASSGGTGAGASACTGIAGATYDTLAPSGPTTDRPAAAHADLNLAMRRTEIAAGAKHALIDLAGATDPGAPKIPTLFAPARTATIAQTLRVEAWDWSCNCGKGFVTDPEVTLVDLDATAGELLHAPKSGSDIGDGHGAFVLYATASTITLKMTREDNVVRGYTVHVDGACIDPALVAAYDAANAAGRKALPALRTGQAFGRARGATVRIAIRDTGSFMDPRSRKDWW